MHKTHAACLGLAAALAFAGPALAQVEVFDDQTAFLDATGATIIAIPASDIAFPSTNCGGSEPTGGDLTVSAQLQILFDANNLTITQDIQGTPPNAARGLCVFDPGFMPILPNTNPNVFPAPVLVGNGEDDYLVVFNTPVHAVGLELLTNSSAAETVTLKDASATVISGLRGRLKACPSWDWSAALPNGCSCAGTSPR